MVRIASESIRHRGLFLEVTGSSEEEKLISRHRRPVSRSDNSGRQTGISESFKDLNSSTKVKKSQTNCL